MYVCVCVCWLATRSLLRSMKSKLLRRSLVVGNKKALDQALMETQQEMLQQIPTSFRRTPHEAGKITNSSEVIFFFGVKAKMCCESLEMMLIN